MHREAKWRQTRGNNARTSRFSEETRKLKQSMAGVRGAVRLGRSARAGMALMEKKYIEFPLIYGSLIGMRHSCAHRWNPRGCSWTGPGQAPASGPSPRQIGESRPSPRESYRRNQRMTYHKIAAKKRKKQVVVQFEFQVLKRLHLPMKCQIILIIMSINTGNPTKPIRR